MQGCRQGGGGGGEQVKPHRFLAHVTMCTSSYRKSKGLDHFNWKLLINSCLILFGMSFSFVYVVVICTFGLVSPLCSSFVSLCNGIDVFR